MTENSMNPQSPSLYVSKQYGKLDNFLTLSDSARRRARLLKQQREKSDSDRKLRKNGILSALDDVMGASSSFHLETDSESHSSSSPYASNSSYFQLGSSIHSDTPSKRRFPRRGSCTMYSMSPQQSKPKMVVTIDERPLPTRPSTAPSMRKKRVSMNSSNNRFPDAPNLSFDDEDKPLQTIDQKPLPMRKSMTATGMEQASKAANPSKEHDEDEQHPKSEQTSRMSFSASAMTKRLSKIAIPFVPNLYVGETDEVDAEEESEEEEEQHPAMHRHERRRSSVKTQFEDLSISLHDSSDNLFTHDEDLGSPSGHQSLGAMKIGRKSMNGSLHGSSMMSPDSVTSNVTMHSLPNLPFDNTEESEQFKTTPKRSKRKSRRVSVKKLFMGGGAPPRSPGSLLNRSSRRSSPQDSSLTSPKPDGPPLHPTTKRSPDKKDGWWGQSPRGRRRSTRSKQ